MSKDGVGGWVVASALASGGGSDEGEEEKRQPPPSHLREVLCTRVRLGFCYVSISSSSSSQTDVNGVDDPLLEALPGKCSTFARPACSVTLCSKGTASSESQ